MSEAYYDIAVVGGELPGLIAAAMLSKKGYRVLVLSPSNQSNVFHVEGHNMIRRPWLFSGFESSEPIKRVLTELSLALEMHNRPKPFQPFYQVVLPGKRVDVTAKENLYQREISREFPDDMVTISQFYNMVYTQNERLAPILGEAAILPPDGFREQRSFKKLTSELNGGIKDPLSGFPEWHPFRSYVLAQLLMSSWCNTEPYSSIQLTRIMSHLNKGLYDIDGGIDALNNMFIDKVTENCGDFREKVTIERFKMKRGKVREIVLKDRREAIGCDVVICNMDVKKFFNLIPEEDQKQRYHLKIHELQPSHYVYTVNFVLDATAIPEGMGRHVFFVGDTSKPLEDHNLLLLCVDPGEQVDPEAKTRVVSATARLRARTVRPTIDNISQHDKAIIEQVKQIIPFFDEHLVRKSSSWVVNDKRSQNLSVDASEFIAVYRDALPQTLDTTPVACRTAYKNVLVAGNHLYSGLALEGAFLGALNTVELTAKMVSRKSLLG